MSIINQMLRDLDARGVAAPVPAPDSSVVRLRRAGTVSRLGSRAAVFLLLLTVAGTAMYFGLPGASNTPAPRVVPVQSVVEPAPVAVASLAHDASPAPSMPLPSRPAAVVAGAEPGAPRAFQLARSLQIGQQAVVPVPRASVLTSSNLQATAPVEPTVIKKAAKLPPEIEAQALFEDAQALRRAGNTEAALAKFRLALERDPGMRQARLQLAGLLQESGQVDAALQLLKYGYEQQPSDRLAIATGRMLAEQGRRDEALNWLERGRSGMRPADHAMMGALLAQAQRLDEAVKAYQQALSVEPRQGGWSLGLGLALESLGRTQEARMAYRNALEYGKFKPEVLKFLQQKTGFPD